MNDGGPAFPSGIAGSETVPFQEPFFGGMSLRDYFAAHAPPVPEAYPHKRIMTEVGGPLPTDWSSEKIDQFRGWGDYLTTDQINPKWLDQINPEWLEDFMCIREERKQMESRNTKKRLAGLIDREVEWRWAYADAMIAQREVVKS